MTKRIRYNGANKPKINPKLLEQINAKGGKLTPTGRAKLSKKKIAYDGKVFDSPHECNRYKDLQLMQKAGLIRDLRHHVDFPLVLNGVEIRSLSGRYHKRGRLIKYEADFVYFDIERGQQVVEDAKGYRTDVYILKRAIMRAMGYHVDES